jgi:hypothetical protein
MRYVLEKRKTTDFSRFKGVFSSRRGVDRKAQKGSAHFSWNMLELPDNWKEVK